jgi:hypothetical protein
MLKPNAGSLPRQKGYGRRALLVGVLWSLCLLGLACAHPAIAQVGLQIVSPGDGSIVKPGQTITVEVSTGAGTSFGAVGIVLQNIGFGPYATRVSPPYVFSVTIPNDVVGRRKITAFGTTGPGIGTLSPSITIDIEPAVTLTALSVSPSMIYFHSAGGQIPLTVTGTFVDGSVLDISLSAHTQYSSNDTTIAVVDRTGIVTAVGPGNTRATEIIVGYGNLSVPVPVSTTALVGALPGDLDGDGEVDCDDLAIVKASFGKRSGQPGFDPRADTNHDGVVNVQDLSFVAQHLPAGTHCPLGTRRK